jgi:succinate dehydrogenase/fumarate reductase flavoprotein subunit
MFLAVWREFAEGRGPVYLKLDHLPEDTLTGLEKILWGTERTVRGQFHQQRNEDYRCWDSVEQGMEEITLCSGHSNSGIWVNKDTETTVPGLFAAGDCAAVPQQYLTGAFVFGAISGRMAAEYASTAKKATGKINTKKEWNKIIEPLKREGGLPVEQVETKIRTKISQYLTPPKSDPLMNKMLWWVDRIRREDVSNVKVCDYHDLIRATEVASITDCAEMAAKASLFRTESRWGLSHYRLNHPSRKDEWDKKFVIVKKDMSSGEMICEKKDVPDYKWEYPTRLEYEYPDKKIDIGEGYTHPPNDFEDPWITEKYAKEGMDIPRRIFPKSKD